MTWNSASTADGSCSRPAGKAQPVSMLEPGLGRKRVETPNPWGILHPTPRGDRSCPIALVRGRQSLGSSCGVTRSPLPISRYRKIPGDKCLGGESPSRQETDMKKKCTSNFLNPSQLVGDSDTGRAQ